MSAPSSLSSTTRMRIAAVAAAAAARSDWSGAGRRPWPRPRSPAAGARRTRCRGRGRRCAPSTVPPCSSTRLRTIASPSPSPPCGSIDRLALLHEQIEDVRQHLRRDADAVVAHAQHDLAAVGARRRRRCGRRAACTWRRWSGGCETTWLSRVRSPRTARPRGGTSSVQRVRPLLEAAGCHLERLARRSRAISTTSSFSSTLPRAMRDTSSRSSTSRVEVVDLALDDGALALGSFAAAQPHQLQRGEDRRERVAQLVPEHREELVLRAVRRLRGLAQRVHLLPGHDQGRHVRGDDEDAVDGAVDVAERRVDEGDVAVSVAPLGRSIVTGVSAPRCETPVR